jgi:hypothetical protein
MKEALHPRNPEIVALINGARARARQVALFAVQQALDRHAISGEPVGKALAALERDDASAVALRPALRSLVESLDAAYWTLTEEDSGSGGATREAFCRARAANSLLAAVQEDACEAALDAIYEAHASLEESDAAVFLEKIKTLLRGA